MVNHGLLSGKCAVVTGAGRNIGRGISKRFAEEGASVVVNDIDDGRATETRNSLANDVDQDHSKYIGDMTDQEDVSDLSTMIEEHYNGLDILVNNVGFANNKNVFETSLREWHKVLNLILTSTFLCTKHLGPIMINSGGGSIINLASRLGHTGTENKTAYCAAKGGVVNMTRQLALDFADHDVRVNSISPGLIGAPVGFGSEEADHTEEGVPLGRIGNPEDIGDAAVYLASDMADYVSGADIAVDGARGA